MGFYRTKKMTLNQALPTAQVAALGARPAAALLTTPTLRLFTDISLVVSPTTLITDFHEATFTGYAAAALASFIGPVILPGNIALLYAQGNFAAGGGIAAGQTVYGYYVTDAVPVGWYLAEVFIGPDGNTPQPFSFNNPSDFLAIDVGFAIPSVLQLNL